MKKYFEHQKQFPTRLSKNKAIQNLCYWGLCSKMFWSKQVKSQRSQYFQLPILKKKSFKIYVKILSTSRKLLKLIGRFCNFLFSF